MVEATQIHRPPLIDPVEIKKALSMLIGPDQVFEIRVLNALTRADHYRRYTASGYFTTIDACIRACADIIAASGIYLTINPVKPGLVTRAYNRLRTSDDMRIDGRTTKDTEILGYRWVPIDIDPTRPDGNDSSSKEEHDRAVALAWNIYHTLKRENKPPAIVADSGNGAHVLYQIDMANTEASTDQVKRLLASVDQRFSNDLAKVDLAVFNPARIIKLYGTRACKGDPTPKWPHRMSRILGGDFNV
jgi:hypothetical protein